ncbi:MAG: hypothetical protein K0S23_3566 [Fluviicola sp.]|jgi:hypothetical protein|uniref:T9SS type A sorting domain-containing protein n=1 Tax=Fluviicola sp. TaxID=1917219 RepID=UPI00260A0FB8|nr:T9SS type A sorting domain-containing protein [Fluviicola sp.]MDF3029259.1 hypothetical protein [Fluviicola sp.]
MRKFITGLFLLIGLNGWGQVDTLEFTTRREVADTLFGLLNPNIYGGALLDRSLTEDSLLNMQLLGDYSGAATAWSWLQAYSDIAVSYADPTYLFTDSALYHKLEVFQLDASAVNNDQLIQPFGLLLHNMSRIDSALFSIPNVFSNQQSQLKLSETYNESEVYSKVLLKSAALLELYGEHGYDEGTIVYDPQFISTSPDISVLSIQLNMGNGFQKFSVVNNTIKYPIISDWQLGQAAINYTIDSVLKQDTLSFYVSTVTYKYKNQEKSAERWDTGVQEYPQSGEKQLEYCIKFGCGNGRKIKRPVIIAPPYRPISQIVGFNTYYDQFDFKSLISSLSEMGYDVIFIKETPGNRGINHAGGILANFLKFINQQKKDNYPNEDWENVVIGFSAGGQHWRYALKKLEKEHMEQNLPHHHTRLYIPYDSPHWGANVPMFAQAVFKDMSAFSFPAFLTYESLKDAASKDMLMNHILGSNISSSGHNRVITPAPTSESQNIANLLNNSFNHQYTPMNDLRKSFPTFTRNVAISTGSNSLDYNSAYGLYPAMKLFKQEIMIPAWYGGRTINRSVYASKYGSGWPIFERKDLYIFLGIPIGIQRNYKTNNAYEWDLAQGGYKDEFYDKGGMGLGALQYTGVPVGAVTILLGSAQSVIAPLGQLAGTQYYKNHMNFLPTVSALGINPAIWQNNNLYYNLKDEGLMFNQFNYDPNIPSNTYGYPNLANPSGHFNVTPFEALYCDHQTYQHIKMQQSVDDDQLDDVYLVYTRNFILDEAEADVVYLQNKVIGKNHIQWNHNYRYKAWYKAYQDIVVGANVSPKTDSGPYTIESTGEITLYACHEINLKPGFSSANGSKFHGFIRCDGCYRPHGKSNSENSDSNPGSAENAEQLNLIQRSLSETEGEKELQVFPNPTTDQFTIVFPRAGGKYLIADINGQVFKHEEVGEENKTIYIRLPKGVYFLKWIEQEKITTKKIIVL